MYSAIEYCRICRNSDLVSILNLGNQALTGIFPKKETEDIPSGPLELLKCDHCGLVQLAHNYDLGMLYGDNYGYRSGLNQSMVKHLKSKVGKVESQIALKAGDIILDIGSNDSTLLQSYQTANLQRFGMDPSGLKFHKYYPNDIELIPDFFSSEVFLRKTGGKKARVVTSIAMFYDLADPLSFVRQVFEILADEGVWVFEQSYMPTMLEQLAYDTVCHEHLEYYALRQIKLMCDEAGFKIVNLEFNDVNGGSFSVTAAKKRSAIPEATDLIGKVLAQEETLGLMSLAPYTKFRERTEQHKTEFRQEILNIAKQGKRVFGYGASTKGNVVLQYCQLTKNEIPYIAEVNEDKFGAFTPGTKIPIISETEAKKMQPDYFAVLPWHFKENIVQREKGFLSEGGKLLFPLPSIHSV